MCVCVCVCVCVRVCVCGCVCVRARAYKIMMVNFRVRFCHLYYDQNAVSLI